MENIRKFFNNFRVNTTVDYTHSYAPVPSGLIILGN